MSQERVRIRLVGILVALASVAFTGRLFYLQIVEGAYFHDLADSQYKASSAYDLYQRGSIYFSPQGGGILTAAGLDRGYTLAINPSVIADAPAAFDMISQYLPDINQEKFMEYASKSTDPYEEIVHRIGEETKIKIEALKIPGVILVTEKWRDYPAGSLAANVLGFVGYKGNVLTGQYGIERESETTLSRRMGNVYQNFFTNLLSSIKNEVFGTDTRAGDVILTIEPRVQALIESKADELMLTWHARDVGIIVSDPKTGAIGAMATRPTFDPNKYNIESDPQVFSNPFVEEVFEMGSIMKPITISSAIDAGLITPETTYLDNGYIELNEKRIENYDGKGRGNITMQDVLNQSLNTGSVYASQKLGKDRQREYMYRFGFQDKTSVDLPGEINNLVSNLESDKEVEFATASFGQGIAVTPITMVRALSALGNGGFLYKPHVIKQVNYDLGYVDETKITEQGRAITGETSDVITRMLVKVVDGYLANGKLKMEHYSIAAKTGTAQIANPDGGGYYTDRFMHSFFGYFPAHNPKFLVS